MAGLINLQKVHKNAQAVDEIENMDVENVSEIGPTVRATGAVGTTRHIELDVADSVSRGPAPQDKRQLLDVEEKFKKYLPGVEKRKPFVEARKLEGDRPSGSGITLDMTDEEIDKYKEDLRNNAMTQANAAMLFSFIQVFALGIERLFSRYVGKIDIAGFSNQITENKAVYLELLSISAAPHKIDYVDGKRAVVPNNNFISKFANLSSEYRIIVKFTTDLLLYSLKSNAYILSQLITSRAEENKKVEDMKIPDDDEDDA